MAAACSPNAAARTSSLDGLGRLIRARVDRAPGEDGSFTAGRIDRRAELRLDLVVGGIRKGCGGQPQVLGIPGMGLDDHHHRSDSGDASKQRQRPRRRPPRVATGLRVHLFARRRRRADDLSSPVAATSKGGTSNNGTSYRHP